uniref:Uncharacterized protein n=1 Tax=Oryzias sinensis TaxID=183150 RepID=A0A8C7WVQ3_9TELE
MHPGPGTSLVQDLLWTRICSGPRSMLIPGLQTASGFPVKMATSAGKKLLLISFDGFRWDYDQDVDTPNLDQLAVDGVKAKYITPPALTMTSPSHFTTITGNCQCPPCWRNL